MPIYLPGWAEEVEESIWRGMTGEESVTRDEKGKK